MADPGHGAHKPAMGAIEAISVGHVQALDDGVGHRRWIRAVQHKAGTAETQAGQLGRLLEVMSISAVSLKVIPQKTERTGVPSAGFWIFDDSLVALEIPTASIEITRPGEVELYTRMFGHLNDAAIGGAGARKLIVRALRELS